MAQAATSGNGLAAPQAPLWLPPLDRLEICGTIWKPLFLHSENYCSFIAPSAPTGALKKPHSEDRTFVGLLITSDVPIVPAE